MAAESFASVIADEKSEHWEGDGGRDDTPLVSEVRCDSLVDRLTRCVIAPVHAGPSGGNGRNSEADQRAQLTLMKIGFVYSQVSAQGSAGETGYG